MSYRLELKGKKIGKLTVIDFACIKNEKTMWLCECECGNRKAILGKTLVRKNNTKSCGCIRGKQKIHGYAGTPTYSTWKAMRRRCTNKKGWYYKNYGGRGIKVCKRWDDFKNFLDDMGEKPEGKSIDRIDNDKGYSPKNCRWATASEQNYNKRNSLKNRKP